MIYIIQLLFVKYDVCDNLSIAYAKKYMRKHANSQPKCLSLPKYLKQ